MPVITKPCTTGLRQRRAGCNEECLRRIAARLCRLDDSCESDSANRAKVTGCCGLEGPKLTGNVCSSADVIAKSCDTLEKAVETKTDIPKATNTNCCRPEASSRSCGGLGGLNAKATTCATAKSLDSTKATKTDCCKSAEKPVDECCRSKTASNEESISTGSTQGLEQIFTRALETTNAKGCCSSKSQGRGSGGQTGSIITNSAAIPVELCADGGRRDEPTGAHFANRNGTVAGAKEPVCEEGCCGEMKAMLKPAEKCVKDCCAGSTGERLVAEQSCSAESDVTSLAGSNEKCVDDCCKILPDGAYSTSYSCSRHLQAAYDQFEAVLQWGLCLCRRVQDHLGFCCCSVTSDGLMQASPACNTHESAGVRAAPKSVVPNLTADSVVHTRCSQEVASKSTSVKSAKARVKATEVDIETAAAREHVIVRVSGMTCTGCSKKMMNVLTNVSGVSNVNVMFVSETAEWDLESTCSVDDVLRRVEKETGFTLIRVVAGYQHLDVYMSNEAATHIEKYAPDGLVSISRGKKDIYELTYNPHIIGARTLMPPNATLAPPLVDKSLAEGRRRLWSMTASFGASLVLTIPIVVLNWGHTGVSRSTVDITSLVLATFVQGIAVPEFYVRAVKSLVYSRVLEMDLLVVISITAAYGYSIIAFGLTEARIHVEEEAFFETSSLLITLVLLGRLMSALARVRAVSAVSLRSLQAETALLVQPDGRASKIDARLLQFGDIIRVSPHARVVTDGKVISGDSAIDESMITGESTLIRKGAGDDVIAGTINNAGTLDVSLTRLPGENSITEISSLVENAISAKPRIQDLADKLASYFVPVVIVVSLIIFLIWIGIAIKVRNRNGGGAVGLAITYGIASLAVSCPCALGLAVPMVLVIAGGVAARAGVIIKAADATERGYKATDVVFDKTGTLTQGDLQVVHTQVFKTTVARNKILSLLGKLIEANDHPVSVAIKLHLTEQPLESSKVENVQSVPGAGIQATFEGKVLKAGNPYWLNLDRHSDVAALLDQAMTIFCVTLDDELLALFGLKSTIREEASLVISELRRRHIECHVVSGDAPRVVEDVARALGFDPENAIARSSPAEKQKYVQNLQDSGKTVVFVGDGTNDAVAVAQANVGVQIGSTSDVTGAVADVVLLGGLDGVVTLLDISKRAFRRITFNFAWTIVYNVFAILMAAGAFVKFRIPPGYAGLGEIASVAPVIIAAMTLTYRGNTVGKSR